jgi:hypothetical protein
MKCLKEINRKPVAPWEIILSECPLVNYQESEPEKA